MDMLVGWGREDGGLDVPPSGRSGVLSGGRFSRFGVDGDGEERRVRMVWMSLVARHVNVARKRAA